jgi:hypothetical protein
MSTAGSFKFGHSHVSIHVEGCYDCGTQWSFAWELFKVLKIDIGGRKREIGLSLCGDCIARRKGTQLELNEQVQEEEVPLTTGELV